MNFNKIVFLVAMFLLAACQEKPAGTTGAALAPLNGVYVAAEPHQNYSMEFHPNGDVFEFNRGKKIAEHKYTIDQDKIVIGGNYSGLRILSPNSIASPGYGEMKKNEAK